MRDPQRESLKCKLYQLAAKTNRGQWADIEQKNDVINIVSIADAGPRLVQPPSFCVVSPLASRSCSSSSFCLLVPHSLDASSQH